MIEQKIRIFRTAAAVRSFTEAAALLGMSQPNVTQQLAKLERELKTPLFFRNGRNVELTPAGEVLRRECERLFAAEAEILQKLRNARSGTGSFTVGGTVTAGSFLLIGLNASFRREFPDYDLFLRIGPQEELTRGLAAGEVELVLTEEAYDGGHFFSEPYCKDRLIPVFAPGFIREKAFSLEAYLRRGGRFILEGFGSGTHCAFRRFLREHALPEPEAGSVTEINSLDAIKILVQSGAGVSVLSELAVENELKAGVLQTAPFAEGELLRNVDFIYLPGGDQRFIQKFIRFSRSRRGLSLRAGERLR